MEKLNVAIVGLGGRGYGMTENLFGMGDIEIVALCDLVEGKVEACAENIVKAGRNKPCGYTDYREMLRQDNIDAVIVMTSWQTHSMICVDAMKAGKHVATEVGCAASLEECWELIRTHKETGKQCMLLENCCYGREEMALMNMIRQGLFGELVNMGCGYLHDLRDEVGNGWDSGHYRIDNYMHRNGDVYPTHGLGPVAQMLNINRGNRFISLTSTASKSAGLVDWVKKNKPNSSVAGKTFTVGDVVTTVIKCAHGETVVVTHDTTLPRPYSRGLKVQGTGGIYMEDNASIYLDGISPVQHEWEPFKPYMEKYEHPLWQWYQTEGIRGGHGGMDFLVLRAFFESVMEGKTTPIDVYDTATWLAVSVLSEASIACGGMPQAFPDFTNGLFTIRK